MRMYDINPAEDNEDIAIFYKIVKMNMIGERIWNSLTTTAQTALQSHKKKFMWTQPTGEQFYDGPTMLQILVETVNPSHMVGILTLKEQIRAVALNNFVITM